MRSTDATHERLVRECYRLADAAVARGDHPFGALLAVDGRVVATARNAVESARDPTSHAETNLLREALPMLDANDRARAVLYASTEPCAMCAAAIYWSGIAAVVYGCSADALAAEAGADFLVPCREVLARGERRVAAIGPVLEAEGRALHRDFWGAHRRSGSGTE